MIFIFFFQAEDGIRDRNVTGVQTCALPIYSHVPIVASAPVCFCRGEEASVHVPDPLRRAEPGASTAIDQLVPEGFGIPLARSEERRVGKECRSRWWRDS